MLNSTVDSFQSVEFALREVGTVSSKVTISTLGIANSTHGSTKNE